MNTLRSRAAALLRRAHIQQARKTRPRVHFLMFCVDGGGGVARTTINLANELAGDHDVEIISLYRRKQRPRFPIDPRITVTYLTDNRVGQRAGRLPREREPRAQPSRLTQGTEYTAWTDEILSAKLGGLRDCILVSTRPSLHLFSVTMVESESVKVIGWDHLNFPTRYAGRVGPVLDRAVPRLDAYVVLTEADARDYRARMPEIDTTIRVIRNSLAWPVASEPKPRTDSVVVAAGRLTRVKGFDRLIDAYALLADDFPTWELHIYGSGDLKAALQQQIEDRGLGGKARLMGFSENFREVLETASVFAMSSHLEGFPMSLIEALSQGVPLVSFDCPRGPGEIVVDNSNGRLVPNGDVTALAKGLAELMADADLRHKMGGQALVDAQQYDVSAIAADWVTLFDDLGSQQRPRPSSEETGGPGVG